MSEYSKDKLIEVFDNVNNNPIIVNIQMKLGRIVFRNLGITLVNQISDKFLSYKKVDFILNDKSIKWS